MKLTARKTGLKSIRPFRSRFLQEINAQVRYNACHERGWSDSYLISLGNNRIGYGSVKGLDNLEDRDTIFEFYLLPECAKYAGQAFVSLVHAANVRHIECQSNDLLLSAMMFEFGENIRSGVVLFADHFQSNWIVPDTRFRKYNKTDVVFNHQVEPVGEYVLEQDDQIVATGGFALHYNIPFADLYMEVRPDCRNQGLGSYLIQELKKACYAQNRIPAARCNINNHASKATLLKAGMKISGFMLTGSISTSP